MVNLIACIFLVYTFSKVTEAQICTPNPCLNNGVCRIISVTPAIYSCSCTAAFTGLFCETPIGCSCLNGGTCLAIGNSFSCTCPSGFSGSNCQLVNPCFYSPCKNGATCNVNSNNDPVCTCLPGFTGNLCQVSLSCPSAPCQNGGTCLTETSYFGTVTQFCKCPANFYGQYCELRLTQALCSSADTSFFLCPVWKVFGFCSFNYRFNFVPIPIYCPSSCDTCRSLLTCVDLQTNCQLWASLNLCNAVNQIDPNMCKRSCNSCAPGVQ